MDETQVESVIKYAASFEAALQNAEGCSPDPFPALSLYLQVLPFPSKRLDKNQKNVLKCHAVAIWSSCNATPHNSEHPTGSKLAEARTFAFLLLFSVTPQKQLKNDTRLFGTALHVAKECLRSGCNELAKTVLEHAASLLSTLTKSGKAEDELEHKSLKINYQCLRVLLHYRDKRADLADFAYKVLQEDLAAVEDETVLEKVVDLCYELGTSSQKADAQSAESHRNALLWLGRASAILCCEDHEILSGTDLRLNVLHRYAQALSCSPDEDHHAEATMIVQQLRHEYGAKLSILLLSLEVHFPRSPAADTDVLADLKQIIETAHTIGANYRLIIYYLRKLSITDHQGALSCLMQYLLGRLVPEQKTDRVEQAIIEYLNIAIEEESSGLVHRARSVETDLNNLLGSMQIPLSCKAAQAAHLLIWRVIRRMDAQDSRGASLLWCQIGMHQLFARAGEAAQGKLERQMISYHLLISNHDAAFEILSGMSFGQKHDKYTRLLEFSAALASGRYDDVQSCLNTIINSAGDHDEILFACVGETIKHNQYLETAKLLQRILDRHIRSLSSKIDLAALLKCTISSFLQNIEQTKTTQLNDEVLYRLCTVFKLVTRRKEDSHSFDSQADDLDWEWFHQRAFDVARIHAKVWPRRFVLDLLHYSRSLLPDALEVSCNSMLKQRYNDIAFMQGLLLASEARSATMHYSIEDMPSTTYDSRAKPKVSECRFVLYKQLFSVFSDFRSQRENTMHFEATQPGNFNEQLCLLVPLAFEALLYMSAVAYNSGETAFDEISITQFLTDCKQLKVPVATYALMADVLLTFSSDRLSTLGVQMPPLIIAKLLGQIIRALRKHDIYNIDQAARCIRCVAQLIFDDIEVAFSDRGPSQKLRCNESLDMLASVLDQVQQMIQSDPVTLTSTIADSPVCAGKKRKRDMVEDDATYPADELLWLISITFNLVVDFQFQEQEHLIKPWAQRVLDLAKVWVRGYSGVRASNAFDQLVTKVWNLGWIQKHNLLCDT